MRKVNEIKNELARTQSKIAELNADKGRRQNQVDDLQNDFIAGKIKSEILQAEQVKLSAVETSINSLSKREESLQSELSEAGKSDEREDRLDRLKTAANDAQGGFNSYLEIRAEFDEMIAEFAEKLFNAKSTVVKSKSAFLSILREEFPALYGLSAGDARGLPEVDKIFAQLVGEGLNPEALKTVQDKHIRVSTLRFGDSIYSIESVYHSQAERERRKLSRQAVS